MSWEIQRRNKKAIGPPEYRIYSTICGGYLTDWLNRKEILQFMYEDRTRQFKMRVIDMCLSFPDKRRLKGTGKTIINKAGRLEAAAWSNQLSHIVDTDAKEYDNFIDRKFQEVLEYLGRDSETWQQDKVQGK